MQRAIKINPKTYNTLNNLKNKMFPFPVSYAKIVEYATDNLAMVYENAQKEKDQDSQRESTEWIFDDNNNIKYQEYLKKKTAQQELIKTTPIQLTPYYKTKVKDYFNSLLIKHDNISKKQ